MGGEIESVEILDAKQSGVHWTGGVESDGKCAGVAVRYAFISACRSGWRWVWASG